MESKPVYDEIIKEYETCKSVTKIAKKLKVSEERVRRTLITEGLWTSRSAAPIIRLFKEGKTVSEIAKELTISEKTVQSYIPYSRGMYGGEQSDTALRSGEYRARMKEAEKNMKEERAAEPLMEELEWIEVPDKGWRFENEPLKKSELDKKPWNRGNDDVGGRRRNYVYQLRFDLTGGFLYGAEEDFGMEPEERKDFLKLAKAKEGISRTVLVPGAMNLHAMHYMILRLFGWQNEHLHRFSLPEECFDALTDKEIDGWLGLCGTLLRFPGGDNADLYWDDDYELGQSVKSWLRSKYRRKYRQYSVTESMLSSMSEVAHFRQDYIGDDGKRAHLKGTDTLTDLDNTVIMEEAYNTLLERLKVSDLFVSIDEKSRLEEIKEEWLGCTLNERNIAQSNVISFLADDEGKGALQKAVDELTKWRALRDRIDSDLFYGKRAEVKKILKREPEEVLREAKVAINGWEEEVFGTLNRYNPKISPAFDTLYYLYDFGDDWCIRITCEKRYKRMTEWDFPDKNGCIIPRTWKTRDGLTTYRYFDEAEQEIKGEDRDRLAEVDVKKVPVCIKSDGMSLVEDAGGVYGFYHMLQTLAGDDEEEKNSMKKWAKSLGWTGRMSKPENIL